MGRRGYGTLAVLVCGLVAGAALLTRAAPEGDASSGCGATHATAGGGAVATGQQPADTELIVKFRAGSTAAASRRSRECVLDQAGRPLGLTFVEQSTLSTGATLLAADRSLDAADVAKLVDRLEEHADVEYAAPNELVSTSGG
jgi:serine protease